jgi:hypothetical protein
MGGGGLAGDLEYGSWGFPALRGFLVFLGWGGGDVASVGMEGFLDGDCG